MAKTLWVIKIGDNDQGVAQDEETARARGLELAAEGMDTVVFKRVPPGHDFFVVAYNSRSQKAEAERRERARPRPTRRDRLSALAEEPCPSSYGLGS
jgi:hypothetical protein